MSHLTPEQIVAYRDGELQDPAAVRHLATCETCRARVTEARLMRDLLRPPRGRQPCLHLADEKTLAAYFDHALSARQTAKVESHLRSCDHCVAQLVALQEATLQPAETSPPPALVERVKGQFGARRERRSLGRVLVEALEGLALRIISSSMLTIAPYPALREMGSAPVPIPPSHPSAASARRRRMAQRFEIHEDIATDAFEFITQPIVPLVGAAVSAPLPSRSPALGTEVPLEFKADMVHLTITIVRNRRGAVLTITAHDISSQTPAQGIELTLVPEQDAPITAKADRQGSARFRLLPGESSLLVHAQHLWELRLNFLSEKS